MSKLSTYIRACSQSQSNYAIEHFVDGSHLTPARRFKQCVIELDSALADYETIEFKVRELAIKLKKKKSKLYNMGREVTHKSELLQVKIDRDISRIARAENSKLSRVREIEAHRTNLAKMEEELGITEDTTEEELYNLIQEGEAEYYITKLALDTAAHLVSVKGGPTVGVSLALQQMPKEDIDIFNKVLQGVLPLVGGAQYNPALHGEGGIQDVMALGEKNLAAIQEKHKP